jgi:hypothetical protein
MKQFQNVKFIEVSWRSNLSLKLIPLNQVWDYISLPLIIIQLFQLEDVFAMAI